MIFKIDLEKAYDNVSWTFLRDTVLELNLNLSWVELIMNCVTSVNSTILWNREQIRDFHPRKGLPQGDPLSPYLFVLCMERLSNLIFGRVNCGEWKGITAFVKGPEISHLFFADDLLLFVKANTKNYDNIMEILSQFSNHLGVESEFG